MDTDHRPAEQIATEDHDLHALPPDDRIRDLAQAGPLIGFALNALECVDWDHLLRGIEAAHTLGPILDPTAYRNALHSGNLADNADAVRAARDFVAAVQGVKDRAVARRG